MSEGDSLRTIVGRTARAVGLAALVKRALLETGLLPERAHFALRGRPPASRAIVLAGSGRSGTTWLADVLCAAGPVQQIFEPLHPEEVAEVGALVRWPRYATPHIRAHYLPADAAEPRWEALLGRMLTGRVRSWWTDPVRTSRRPERFLVKLIRANLMLGFLCDRFAPDVVLVVRHPCAVVASRLRAPWSADVRDILGQEQLVEDHLRPWLAEIERERDLLGAHAVWWAVENLVATRQLSGRRHHFVHFEDFCLEPQSHFRTLLEWVELDADGVDPTAIEAESRMTHPGVGRRSTLERLGAWRQQLAPADQRRILDWAHRLGLTWYDESPTPCRRGHEAGLAGSG
jgi:hypothetical protein